jgi:hypothetical protein
MFTVGVEVGDGNNVGEGNTVGVVSAAIGDGVRVAVANVGVVRGVPVAVNVGVAVAAGDWFAWPWLRAVAVSAVATTAVRV